MNKRMALAAVIVLFAIGLCTSPLFAVVIPFTMTFYSDASHAVQIGECHYNSCEQWAGTGNMTCTGSTSDYWVYGNYHNCNNPVK